MYVRMYVCVYVCMCECIFVCMYVCMFVCVCMYVCMYVCIFINIQHAPLQGNITRFGLKQLSVYMLYVQLCIVSFIYIK